MKRSSNDSTASLEPRELDSSPELRLASPLLAWLLRRLRRRVVEAPVRLVLWTGDAIDLGPATAASPRIRVRSLATLLRLAWDPADEFGEAYARGDIEVEGDLVELLEAVYRGWRAKPQRPSRLGGLWRSTLVHARRNARHHYDIGNDFYEAWLDRELVYTCAYFPRRGTGLEEAQRAKMEYVCRKLRLSPGESVLEAGCGWGALALYMARHYGVRVVACNVSREQIAWARRRARQEGLDFAVTFVEDDYRNLRGRFDAFVSVGMLEHVGRRSYRDLGRRLDGWLDPEHGRGLLHFIGRNRPGELNRWIRKRIFPGAYPPVLSEVASRVLEPWDLEVEDVENLRLHYALTLRHWRRRFEAAAPDLARRYDAALLRSWRVYLAGSEVAFTTGYLQLFQLLFARSPAEGGVRTREALYREPLPAEPETVEARGRALV
jgi:cyclopropane-fatty-acyl-phospholipid synthase